jgi:hypothetical protein
MAYINQAQKKAFAPKIKALCAKYGVKGTLSIDGGRGILLTLHKGKIDFGTSHVQVNTYHVDDRWPPVAKEFLTQAVAILNEGNHNNSDLSIDYFDIGWYVYVNVGKWDMPYIKE